MKQSVISARNISIGYAPTKQHGRNELYKGLSFDLYEGELTSLLGLNGAGKSTLLRTLSAMQPTLTGDILLRNKSVSEYSEDELSRNLGLVLTDKTSVGGFTVSQLVALGRYPYTGFFGRLSKRDHEIVQKAMDDVSIAHKSNVYVAELSDGEKQKAMIAKALAQECPILLLDEPTAFLDVSSRIEIMSLLHTLASKHQKTILLSTHDIELAFLLADRLWLLSRENGLKCGVTEDLILNNSVQQFFEKEGIIFDKHTGSFLPRHEANKFVFVRAEADILHWVENFLRRNGFALTVNKQEACFILDIEGMEKIKIEKEGQVLEVSSFEVLLSVITDILPV